MMAWGGLLVFKLAGSVALAGLAGFLACHRDLTGPAASAALLVCKKLCKNYANIMQKLCNVPGMHYYACIMQNNANYTNHANYASLRNISKSGGNYLIIICNYLNYLKTRQLFENYLIII